MFGLGFKLLRTGEVFIAALGGTLVGFTFGMPDICNKAMSELGIHAFGRGRHAFISSHARAS